MMARVSSRGGILMRRLWNGHDLTDEGCALIALLIIAAILASMVI